MIWKDDILNHRCCVFLSEKDSIINARKVFAYLQNESDTSRDESHSVLDQRQGEPAGSLRVVWCPELDHGQVFDIRRWRARLKSEVLGEARQAKMS